MNFQFCNIQKYKSKEEKKNLWNWQKGWILTNCYAKCNFDDSGNYNKQQTWLSVVFTIFFPKLRSESTREVVLVYHLTNRMLTRMNFCFKVLTFIWIICFCKLSLHHPRRMLDCKGIWIACRDPVEAKGEIICTCFALFAIIDIVSTMYIYMHGGLILSLDIIDIIKPRFGGRSHPHACK